MMRFSKWRVAGILGLVAVVGLVIKVGTLWQSPVPRDIVLDINGVNGTAVELLVETDGMTQTIQKILPTTVKFNAHSFAWQVSRLDRDDREPLQVAMHLPPHQNWTHAETSKQELSGGFIGPIGLRRERTWHGRFDYQ